jgi:methylmalonyl-CoA/ethylmalonyl-CoA epimerase
LNEQRFFQEFSMLEIKKINHIAMLVENIDQSLHFWQEVLGLQPSKISHRPDEAARIAFFPIAECEIELVQPTTRDSGLSRFLEKHGAGMHHLCLEVDDLSGMLEKLKSAGVQLINDQPKQGEDGRLYAFIHPKSSGGVLLELYQVKD